jgi:tetratricopeptide (TPR) repeat protein
MKSRLAPSAYRMNSPRLKRALHHPRSYRFRIRALKFKFLLMATALTISTARTISAQPQSAQAVEAASIEGVVRDSDGKPVRGISILLTGQNITESETKSRADGTFEFSSLRAGPVTIQAGDQALRPAAKQSLELSPGEKKHIALILGTQDSATAGAGARAAPGADPDRMEFSDQPNFTVAGMTDWSNLGLHGSDVTSRTSEALAKDTVALKSGAPPESPPSSGASAGTSHRLAGDRDEKSGDPLAAVHEYQQAVRLDPSEENYFAWGSELLLHRAVQPAAEIFTEGSARHPQSARMLAGLGAALYADGLYDEAARRLCAASDLNPGDSVPYVFLGKMAETAGDSPPCGEEKLARFAQEQPANALANYYYAVSIWKRARRSDDVTAFSKARALLERAIALDPGLAEADLQLGILYAAQGDFPRARQVLENAVSVNPQLGETHYRLGQVYQRSGEAAKAQQEFALYKQCEKSEADTLERQRRELRQFLVVLQDHPAAPAPH